jgi:antitoxin ParD1/3/4
MLNISLPEQLQAFVEAQAQATGLGSTSAYVCQLIVREQARVAQQVRVEALLLEGLESGDGVEATNNWWDEKRARLVEQYQPPEQ